MGEILYGSSLPYPDLGLIFDDVSYSTPLYGDKQDGLTNTPMTLYNFLLTSDYPQWVEKDIVLSLGSPIPIDMRDGLDTGVWYLRVGYMVADGENLYLEILSGGRGCLVALASGTGRDCSTLKSIPISAICSLCMPEGERWDRCPPLPPPLPPVPPPTVECMNNWGVINE